jgi:hypothetical protein
VYVKEKQGCLGVKRNENTKTAVGGEGVSGTKEKNSVEKDRKRWYQHFFCVVVSLLVEWYLSKQT